MSSIFEKIKNAKALLGQEQVSITENVEFINAIRQWKKSQGMNPIVTLNGDQAKEFLKSIGDPNPTDTLRQSGCKTNTCDMTKMLSTSQLNTMSMVSQIKGLPKPSPQAKPKPKPKPQAKPGGMDPKTAERMQKRDLKTRERMHKREVKGAVKQAKYAAKAGKPTMMQRLGNVAKTLGRVGAFAAGVPASYATPQNQRRRVSESSDINTSMDQQKLQERGDTLKFIKSVSEKNYSEADKYLKQIVDNKLVQKMSKFKDTEI